MRITIIGTGYVGLTTGVGLASVGHHVTCVDIVPERVEAINAGRSPFYEPGLDALLAEARGSGRLDATADLAPAVAASEVTLITVGTPQRDDGIDLSYIAEAARQTGAALRDSDRYHVVAVRSTVVPGTTDTLVRTLLEETSGRRAGEGFGLCMNPEFMREGSAVDDFKRPDRVVIGQWDERSGETLARVYESFDCPKVFTTLRNAEMIKYAANSLLATLISFSNEIAALCEATPGTDVELVMKGVHLDRRLTVNAGGERVHPEIVSFLRAGCGYGGSCFPKDVNALRDYARGRGVEPRILDAVVETNEGRPAQVVGLAERALGRLDGAAVAVLGLAFKPDTDDLRESPALTVIRLLTERGASVRAYDPVLETEPDALRAAGGDVHFCRSLGDALRGADAAFVITSWREFAEADWAALAGLMRRQVVVDGRNFLRGVRWPESVTYLGVGVTPSEAKAEGTSAAQTEGRSAAQVIARP